MTEDTTRKTFEPTVRCIARHAVQFAVLFIVVSTIGSWITGAEPWGPDQVGLLVLWVQVPTTIVCLGPERLRTWANNLFG